MQTQRGFISNASETLLFLSCWCFERFSKFSFTVASRSIIANQRANEHLASSAKDSSDPFVVALRLELRSHLLIVWNNAYNYAAKPGALHKGLLTKNNLEVPDIYGRNVLGTMLPEIICSTESGPNLWDFICLVRNSQIFRHPTVHKFILSRLETQPGNTCIPPVRLLLRTHTQHIGI